MKWAVSLGASGPPIGALNDAQMSHFVLAALQIDDVRDHAPGIGPELNTSDVVKAVVYSFRNAARNHGVEPARRDGSPRTSSG